MPSGSGLASAACLDEPEDAPTGVTLVDAEKTMPRSRFFVDRKTQYYAMFSDLFRYALLRAGAGIYVDCDVYCLKPIPDAEYIYGWDTGDPDDIIATGVLKLPPGCPLLDDMWKAANDPAFVPPWFKASKRAKLHQRLCWDSTAPPTCLAPRSDLML